MSNKFLKKLRREATANPKKAALLGMLLLAAVYFWAPLIRQWTNPTSETAVATSPAAPPAAAPVSSPAAGATAPAPPPKPNIHWRDLAKAMEGDPRMRPADRTTDPSPRDPFAVQKSAEQEEQAKVDEPVVEKEVTPGEAGLVLSGTIVGERRRTAVINGKVYGPGRELKSADGVVFVVRKIEPWGIVLERAGRQFELALPRPTP